MELKSVVMREDCGHISDESKCDILAIPFLWVS